MTDMLLIKVILMVLLMALNKNNFGSHIINMMLIVHHYVCHCFDIVMPVTTKPNEPICH